MVQSSKVSKHVNPELVGLRGLEIGCLRGSQYRRLICGQKSIKACNLTCTEDRGDDLIGLVGLTMTCTQRVSTGY